MKVWTWFSGRKSAIGGYFLLAAWAITEFVIGDWGVTAEVLPKITGTLSKIGILLTGGGGIHKIAKAIKSKTML